jgi:cell wall assembly regulator SMI1
VDAVLAELGQWLNEHRTDYARALQPGASDSMLDQCSAVIGKPLPDELRALYRWHDGQAEDASSGATSSNESFGFPLCRWS